MQVIDDQSISLNWCQQQQQQQ